MISKLHLEDILFLDIETVPETEKFSELDTAKQELWDAKSRYQRKEEFTAKEFYERTFQKEIIRVTDGEITGFAFLAMMPQIIGYAKTAFSIYKKIKKEMIGYILQEIHWDYNQRIRRNIFNKNLMIGQVME